MISLNRRGIFDYLVNRYSQWASARIDRKICKDGAYWLFIIGVNNSGTTVLANLLKTHPYVRTLPAEGQHLTSAFPKPASFGVVRLWSNRMDVFRWTENHSSRPALRAKKDWIKQYSGVNGLLLEKSPPNTVRSLWLQKNFTPNRFLAIIRNPYAVCEGISRRTNCTIYQAAQHWVTSNTCMLEDLKHIRNSLLIKYEDLVDDPKSTLTKIEAFLGLEKAISVEECDHVQAHSANGMTEGLKNLNGESLNRLTQIEINAINSLCGDLIRLYGYSVIETKT